MVDSRSQVLQTAQTGFQLFTEGLATGEWEPFLSLLTDDFCFWFPIGSYHGLNEGKTRAREFFHYVSETFKPGLKVTLSGITSNETTVIFEIKSEGLMRGEPYKNRVAIAFDIRDNKICGYREYLGSDGKSY
jgi:ketosteroid isomerase-like protein